MHTLAGEVKACFAMLSGDAYTASNKIAQAIKDFEGKINHRYMPAQVCLCLQACLRPLLCSNDVFFEIANNVRHVS